MEYRCVQYHSLGHVEVASVFWLWLVLRNIEGLIVKNPCPVKVAWTPSICVHSLPSCLLTPAPIFPLLFFSLGESNSVHDRWAHNHWAMSLPSLIDHKELSLRSWVTPTETKSYACMRNLTVCPSPYQITKKRQYGLVLCSHYKNALGDWVAIHSKLHWRDNNMYVCGMWYVCVQYVCVHVCMWCVCLIRMCSSQGVCACVCVCNEKDLRAFNLILILNLENCFIRFCN